MNKRNFFVVYSNNNIIDDAKKVAEKTKKELLEKLDANLPDPKDVKKISNGNE